jgi:hypothetical protein
MIADYKLCHIPVDGIDFRVELSVAAFLAAYLEIVLWHGKSRQGAELRFHHGNKGFIVCDQNELEKILVG